jgi:hypothetical protein
MPPSPALGSRVASAPAPEGLPPGEALARPVRAATAVSTGAAGTACLVELTVPGGWGRRRRPCWWPGCCSACRTGRWTTWSPGSGWAGGSGYAPGSPPATPPSPRPAGWRSAPPAGGWRAFVATDVPVLAALTLPHVLVVGWLDRLESGGRRTSGGP